MAAILDFDCITLYSKTDGCIGFLIPENPQKHTLCMILACLVRKICDKLEFFDSMAAILDFGV